MQIITISLLEFIFLFIIYLWVLLKIAGPLNGTYVLRMWMG